MGGIILCPKHGAQGPASTSARLSEALWEGKSIPEDWVSLVIVQEADQSSFHIVDSQRIVEAGLDPAASPFLLRDRDIAQKQLNDRLLIQKILHAERQAPRVCARCLAAAVQPQATPRLAMTPNARRLNRSGGAPAPNASLKQTSDGAD